MDINDNIITILDSISAMGYKVDIIDKLGYITYASDNCNYDLYSGSEMLGMHMTEAYNLSWDGSVMLECLRTGVPRRNYLMRYTSRSTGKELVFLYDCFPIVIRGSVDSVIGIYRPLDELKSVVSKLSSITDEEIASQTYKMSKRSSHYQFSDIIFASEEMSLSIEHAKRAAMGDFPVLLVGETGTGKELFAQSIHSFGPHSKEPFLAVNCAALPPNLIESILFGTVKGAYTGALDREGLFESSGRGSIFLDELQSLSPELQLKLLRVIEEHSVRRVGSNMEIPIHCRLITAMNVDPVNAIKEGKLKADLFYRIAVIMIDIPPLRSRKRDIELLSSVFLKRTNERLGRSIKGFSSDVMEIFHKYTWPGNVRELLHVIEASANMMRTSDANITVSDLPKYILDSDSEEQSELKQDFYDKSNGINFRLGDFKLIRQIAADEYLKSFTKRYLVFALESCDWNISKTARALKLSRQHLYSLMKEYNIVQGK